MGVPSYRVSHFVPSENDVQLRLNLDLLEERRHNASLRVAAYQQTSARYFNSKVKQRGFRVGDLVLRRVMLNTRELNAGSLGPTWEGPYQVVDIVCLRTYRLQELSGELLPHPWNAEHLKLYYK